MKKYMTDEEIKTQYEQTAIVMRALVKFDQIHRGYSEENAGWRSTKSIGKIFLISEDEAKVLCLALWESDQFQIRDRTYMGNMFKEWRVA